ncbi:MAG: hypothetical protein K0U47_02030 [Epsilonproteobacteria bacterium]|nr:hypothetical protein [Campylobacterota bacterium]
MKLLFICDKIDLHLKHRLDALTTEGIETECLVLPKLTLYKNWEKEVIEVESGLGFLEKSGTLQTLALAQKYKKLFETLPRYDSVNLYKATSLCAPYLDHIKKLAKSYFITVEPNFSEQNRHISKLFEHAHCLLFESQSQLDTFETHYGYDEKTLITRDENHLFGVIDSVKDDTIEKFKHYLNLSESKHIVYCDLGSDISMQKRFIKDLLKLSAKQLRETTFIFDPVSSTLIDKEMLIEFLEDKQFDYLLPESLLSDEQKAMLLTLSQSSMILPGSGDYSILYPSLYVKNHVYCYERSQKEKKMELFIDDYENFENATTFNEGSHHLVDELTQKNREIMTTLYHPTLCLENYLKVLKVL